MVCEECLLRQLAAFVDGEGTIGINRTLLLSGGYSYSQRLLVTGTDIRLMNWLVDNFGGKFPKEQKRKRENHKDLYEWQLCGYKSYNLIKKIRKYLLLKQEQADCAMELYVKFTKLHYGSTNPIPDYKRKLAEELYQMNKKLNRKGKYNNDEEVEITVKIRKDVLDDWLE